MKFSIETKLPPIENRPPDHFLLVSLIGEHIQLHNVRCKVFLPKTEVETALLYFYPTEYEAQTIRGKNGLYKFAIKGKISQANKTVLRIEADNVYLLNFESQWWGDEIQESVLVSEPYDLRIIEYLERDLVDYKHKIHGHFWLSLNQMLSPIQSILYEYTGNVKVDTIRSIQFAITDEVSIDLRRYYKNQNTQDGGGVITPRLVAEFELPIQDKEPIDPGEEVVRAIDNFLLVASFASRHKCVWLGWELCSDNILSTFYRGDIRAPESDNPTSLDGVVASEYFEEFLQTAYSVLKNTQPTEQRELLKQALNYAIPNENLSVETSFIKLYSALETLVLFFRRNNDLEKVFGPNEVDNWKILKSDLKSWLKDHPLLQGQERKNKRQFLYDNINALERISFGTALSRCCVYYSIDITDLWPITGNPKSWSLSEIRNKLVHGDYIPRAKSDILMTAHDNLQWIVERLMLVTLGWDVSQSKVSPKSLSQATSYINWRYEHRLMAS